MRAVNKESVAVFAAFKYPRTRDCCPAAAIAASYHLISISLFMFTGGHGSFTLFVRAWRRANASFAKVVVDEAIASESVELNDPTALVSVVVVPMFLSRSEKC